MPDDQTSRGALWVPVLLIGAIFVASLPMLAGILVTALVPWFGHLRVPVWTVLLHMLWMYPTLWLYSLISDPIEKFYVAAAKQRAAEQGPGRFRPGLWIERLADLCGWGMLSLIYISVFSDALGVMFASLITALLYKPTVAFLERNSH